MPDSVWAEVALTLLCVVTVLDVSELWLTTNHNDPKSRSVKGFNVGMMSEKETKKRKRQSSNAATPNKKVAFGGESADRVTIQFASENGLHPVVASSPGLIVPTIPFVPYAKPLSSKSKGSPKPTSHHLLLHSSAHPRLDYVASPSSLEQQVSHYLAVFDPSTRSLQVTPSHFLSFRSTLRSEIHEVAQNETRRTFAQQREDLGREFGTKKAKKFIADRTVNAINTDSKGKGKRDGVQSAILDAVDAITAQTPTKDAVEQSLLDAKPIPRPRLDAQSVEEVYSFSTLLPPGDARLVQIKDWHEKACADEAITFNHRFPAFRVSAIGKSGQLDRLQALRYLTLLLEFHDALQKAGRTGKKVPKKELLAQKLASWPDQLVDSVRRRFSDPNNELSKWHVDNLYTHICALSLFVDGWTTDITHLKEDLRMENRAMIKYFGELGCKIGAPTEKERAERKLNKAQATATRIAKLRLPLEFPKSKAARRR